MDSDAEVEVIERSSLLSSQSHSAIPPRQGEQVPPELIGVTPTGRALWLNFDARRDSAEWYLKRYYEHLSELDLDEPIRDRVAAAADAAIPGTRQSKHLHGVLVCADDVIRNVKLMEELLAHVQEVRIESEPPKQLSLPGVATAGSLATMTASALLLPAKIATWVALSSVGVAVSTVMVGWAIRPRDLKKHYETLQARLQSFRSAVEQCDDDEIKKQQHVLNPKTFVHLRSDLMYRWPTTETSE
ncbi:hypothetical protein B0T21DRAFT_348780 [Apiosordaria backusii]|uniref:Transmembrane protein n=1 Tax=Apiosordaria backusii TaxID=314023 RepID=A0AA40BM36_9PEZI|nr:hypothetical protein B0T21DRAFT_348780 [Apiosordaria backusii]